MTAGRTTRGPGRRWSDSSDESVGAPVGVLLVDDRSENLLALEAILEPLGNRLVRARSGAEAIRAATAEEFAVVLLDVMMPGMDGLETARRISSLGRDRPTPILFLTAADADARGVSEAYAAGGVDYITKPFDPDVIRAKVRLFAELYRQRDALRLAKELQDQALQLEQQMEESQALSEELAQANEELHESAAAAEEARDAAEAARQRVSDVLDSMSDAYVTLDRQWRILHLNPAAERLTGRTAVSLIGRVHWEAFPPTVGTELERQYRQAMATGIAAHFEYQYSEPEQLDLWLDIDAYPSGDGLSVFFRDITVRKRAEQAMRRAEEESRRAAQIVGESEARFRSLVVASSQVVWTTDPNGNVADMPAWRELTGQTVEQVRGAGWLDALHPADRPRTEQAWHTAVATRAPYAAEYRLRLANDSYRWFSARGTPVLESDGTVREWVGVCQDIDRVKRDTQAKAFLARASTILAGALDYRATLDIVARLAVGTEPAAAVMPDDGIAGFADACAIDVPRDGADAPPWFERVAIASCDPASVTLAAEMERAYPTAPDAALGYPHVIRTGESALVSEVDDAMLTAGARDERHLAMLKAFQMYSAMVVPLTARGRTLGAMTLVLHGPSKRRPFDHDDLLVAEELGRRAGIAIDNARLYEAETAARAAAERESDRTRRLQQVTAALSEALTPDDVADVIVQLGFAAVGADAGSIALLVDDGRMFEVVRTVGYPDDSVETFRRFPRVDGRPLSDVVERREPTLVSTRAEWLARYPVMADAIAESNTVAFAGVPAITARDVLAAIAFTWHDERHFDDGLREFLVTLGQQCGQALERARLYEAERRSRAGAERAAERTTRLQAVTAELASALTPAQVARIVVQQGTAALGADAGIVMLVSADGQWLEIADALGYPEARLEEWRRCRVDAAVPLAEAFRAREPIVTPNAAEWSARYPTLYGAFGFEGSIAIPLVVEETAIGAMTLSFRRPIVELDEEDHAFALALARQCAQAIRRASLYAAAELARAEADRANRTKSEFLATMSHELRTPLTAIIGYEELLADGITGPVTDAQRGQLRRIKASATHLLSLIDEILTFSRVEAGRETVRLAEVDVARALDDAASMVAPLAEHKGLTLRYVPPDESLTVQTDVGKLQQMLVNLLGNAVKFTEHGGIELSAVIRGSRVHFSVRDSGIGIPPEQLERIFQPFTQVESTATRKFGGTGLGLSVTRQLARLLGGDVRVESVVGQGSLFVIDLPRGE